jgi:hypothetical protein
MPSIFSNAKSGLGSATKFAPDYFRGIVTTGFGLATNNKFEVDFPNITGMTKPNGGVVSNPATGDQRVVLCTAANIPGKTINTVERQVGDVKYAIANGQDLGTCSFSFYLDNTYSMRHYFYEWMNAVYIQDDTRDGLQMQLGYWKNYAFGRHVKIKQYTKNARRVYSCKLIDCYPISVNVIELNNQLATQTAEMTVTMAYRTYWGNQDK